MNFRWKLFLSVFLIIFASGLLISFKGHQLIEEHHVQNLHSRNFEVNQIAAELMLQKVEFLENSVAVLDRSTAEVFKRFGVEYFAYGKKVDNQWKVKWKVIGSLKKPEIVKQTKALDFDTLSSNKRSWKNVETKLPLLITPASMAKTQSLSTGFVIFALSEKFFGTLELASPSVQFIPLSEDRVSLGSKGKKMSLAKADSLFKMGEPANTLELSEDSENYIASSVFAKDLQLWLVNISPNLNGAFWSSAPLKIFILFFTFLLVCGFYLMRKFPTVFQIQMPDSKDSPSPLLRLALVRLSSDLEKLKKYVGEQPEPLSKISVLSEIENVKNWLGTSSDDSIQEIRDFNQWIETVILLKREALTSSDISLTTQVEESVSVHCSVVPLEEFILRLFDNSIKVLADNADRRIHIKLIRDGNDGFRLIYQDSRNSLFPQVDDEASMLSMVNPIEDIDGVMAYGQLAFGDQLTIAGSELLIELSFNRASQVSSGEIEALAEELETIPLMEVRPSNEVLPVKVEEIATKIETTFEMDTPQNTPVSTVDPKVVEQIKYVGNSLEKAKEATPPPHPAEVIDPGSRKSGEAETLGVEIDEMVESFSLKDFSFENLSLDKQTENPIEEPSPVQAPENERVQVQEGKDGLMEFKAGEIKLKIRPPKKREKNVYS